MRPYVNVPLFAYIRLLANRPIVISDICIYFIVRKKKKKRKETNWKNKEAETD